LSADSESERIDDQSLFRWFLRRAAEDPANRDSIVTDGFHECRLPEIPRHLGSIQAWLRRGGVSSGECVALELNNSVRGALSILALFDGAFSFTVLPTPGRGARAVSAAVEHPAFVRWIVTVAMEKPDNPLAETPPERYLSLRSNPAFDRAAIAPPDGDPRLFFRTSGSMGASKLVMYRYRSFFQNVLDVYKLRSLDASYRIALPIPIFHRYGLSGGLLVSVASGASIDLHDRSNVLRFLEREAEFEPNVALVVPTICETLVRTRRSRRPYRYLITGGDSIAESTFARSEELHGPMLSQYGSTEYGAIASCSLDMPYEQRLSSVGRIVEGVETRIVPIEGAEADDRGELQVRRRYKFEGHVDMRGRPVTLPGTYDGDWYRTGDLAVFGSGETLRLFGRCDLSVNRNGVLLPLREVESRLMELDGIVDAAVALGPDTARGRALVAFCTVAPGTDPDVAKLRSGFAAQAPAFSVPDEIRILAELPKLENGKIDRNTLARLASAPE
jgi:acyl-CoA synthetase (AMP-forming)/AMP-acid ligase II